MDPAARCTDCTTVQIYAPTPCHNRDCSTLTNLHTDLPLTYAVVSSRVLNQSVTTRLKTATRGHGQESIRLQKKGFVTPESTGRAESCSGKLGATSEITVENQLDSFIQYYPDL